MHEVRDPLDMNDSEYWDQWRTPSKPGNEEIARDWGEPTFGWAEKGGSVEWQICPLGRPLGGGSRPGHKSIPESSGGLWDAV
jgi:hypothetical protein